MTGSSLQDEIMDLIQRHHPEGMTMREAGDVLRILACVSGEILSLGTDANREGFVAVLDLVRSRTSSALVVMTGH